MNQVLSLLLIVPIILTSSASGGPAPTTMPVEVNSGIGLRLYRPNEAANEYEPYPLVLEIRNDNASSMTFPTWVGSAWREPPNVGGTWLRLVVRPATQQPRKPTVYLSPPWVDISGRITIGAGKSGLLRVEVPPEFLIAERKEITAVLTIDGKIAAVSEPMDVTKDLGERR